MALKTAFAEFEVRDSSPMHVIKAVLTCGAADVFIRYTMESGACTHPLENFLTLCKLAERPISDLCVINPTCARWPTHAVWDVLPSDIKTVHLHNGVATPSALSKLVKFNRLVSLELSFDPEYSDWSPSNSMLLCALLHRLQFTLAHLELRNCPVDGALLWTLFCGLHLESLTLCPVDHDMTQQPQPLPAPISPHFTTLTCLVIENATHLSTSHAVFESMQAYVSAGGLARFLQHSDDCEDACSSA